MAGAWAGAGAGRGRGGGGAGAGHQRMRPGVGRGHRQRARERARSTLRRGAAANHAASKRQRALTVPQQAVVADAVEGGGAGRVEVHILAAQRVLDAGCRQGAAGRGRGEGEEMGMRVGGGRGRSQARWGWGVGGPAGRAGLPACAVSGRRGPQSLPPPLPLTLISHCTGPAHPHAVHPHAAHPPPAHPQPTRPPRRPPHHPLPAHSGCTGRRTGRTAVGT